MSSRKYRVLWGAAFALTGFIGGQNQAHGDMTGRIGQGAPPADDTGIDVGTDIGMPGGLDQGGFPVDTTGIDVGTDIGVPGGLDQGELPVDTTGINVVSAADMTGRTDVTHIEYEISRVACVEDELFSPLRLMATEELAAMRLPGGIPELEDNPLDAGSEHSFADHFESLPPGCYDVRATPLQADGSASLDCEGAIESNVFVEDGQTTDIFLMSQCRGEPAGALDAAMTLNQPPSLQTLGFTPSKFIRACEKTTVCATAVDPDNDPIELVWKEAGSRSLRLNVVLRQRTGNEMTECVEIRPSAVGERTIEVRAYDLVHDPDLGLVRVERWLRDHGSLSTSHDTMRFPVYVGL
jgi:hypothetical protein